MDTLALGPVAPFDAAAVVMVVGGLVVLASWPENYGDASNKHTLPEQLANAARAIYNGALRPSHRVCPCMATVPQPHSPPGQAW